ncbi:MAG: hypothetical protein ACFFDB_10995 [Promethearchaeota archaeon]
MDFKIIYNDNKSTQIEQAIKMLASWIGEAVPISNNTFIFLTIQNNSKKIEKLNLNEANNLKKIDDFLIYRDNRNIQNTETQIYILAIGDRGLANGLYHLYMKLKEQQTQNPFSINWNVFESPFFEMRCMMVNMSYGLDDLSTENWTLSQWKRYFNRLRSFNYTSIMFIMTSFVIYHPDYEELEKNSWRYDVYDKLFKYAKEIGLEIILFHVFNALPTELWIKFPDIRAEIFLYQGITHCTQKGKNVGDKLLNYTLKRFKNVSSHALITFEAGGCNCEYCRNNLADLIVEYLNFIKENGNSERLFFMTWFANVKEYFDIPPIKGLRDQLFSKIPKEVKILDITRKTLKMAIDQGYEVYDFVFLLDPEGGVESQLIFPKPHINLLKERISDSIRALGSNLKGMVGYRVLPKTRFIDDYAFCRYLWNPEIAGKDIISEVAGLLASSINEKQSIINAIQLLEDFWTSFDGNKLKESNKILEVVVKQQNEVPEPLKSIQEATKILYLLFHYSSVDSERLKDRIVHKIFQSMREMDTFQCYTSYNFWDFRSFEMIKQRIGWWTDSGIGLFDPKSYPWNSHLKGKYNLVDTKEDAFLWMKGKE